MTRITRASLAIVSALVCSLALSAAAFGSVPGDSGADATLLNDYFGSSLTTTLVAGTGAGANTAYYFKTELFPGQTLLAELTSGAHVVNLKPLVFVASNDVRVGSAAFLPGSVSHLGFTAVSHGMYIVEVTTSGRDDDTSTPPGTFTVAPTVSTSTYQLHYAAGPNGTLSGTTSQTVDYNGVGSTVTANPDAGYHFVNWSDTSTANPRTDSDVIADATYTANFALNAPYTPPTRVSSALHLSGPRSGSARHTWNLSGTLSPAVTSGRVFLTYWRFKGGAWRQYGRASAAIASGRFSSSIKPPTKGQWRVFASYGGSADYGKAPTVKLNFTVK
ncbi:MAG: hypothetical protein P4L93_01065 [Coriobacteriia bacterium]|nr:hypothetical protein [Coriobacteriia bacterium]